MIHHLLAFLKNDVQFPHIHIFLRLPITKEHVLLMTQKRGRDVTSILDAPEPPEPPKNRTDFNEPVESGRDHLTFIVYQIDEVNSGVVQSFFGLQLVPFEFPNAQATIDFADQQDFARFAKFDHIARGLVVDFLRFQLVQRFAFFRHPV